MTILVWDASALHHAAKAERLDVLGDLARGPDADPWVNVTTYAVWEELAAKALDMLGADWLGDPIHVDGLDMLTPLFRWAEAMGAKDYDRGEVTVFAYATVTGSVAIVDDDDAKKVGQDGNPGLDLVGLPVHGSLWVVCSAIRHGRTTAASADRFVDVVQDAGARYPFPRGRFLAWARGKKLID